MCKQQAPRRAPLAARAPEMTPEITAESRAPEMGHWTQLAQQPLDLRLDLDLHLICLDLHLDLDLHRIFLRLRRPRAARTGRTALEGSDALEGSQLAQRMARRRPLPVPRLRPRHGTKARSRVIGVTAGEGWGAN